MRFNQVIYIKSEQVIKTVWQCRETQRFVSNYVFVQWNKHIVTKWINIFKISHLFLRYLMNNYINWELYQCHYR